MREELYLINATSERLWSLTRGKYTISYDELAVIKAEIETMLDNVVTCLCEYKEGGEIDVDNIEGLGGA